MRRRKYIAAVGSLAAGGAAMMGTGALSVASTSRDANMNVVSDSSGLVALTDELPGDTVRKENNELLISFAGGGSHGVNIDSEYELGDINFNSGNIKDSAFELQNNSQRDLELEATYTLDGGQSALNQDGSFVDIHVDELGGGYFKTSGSIDALSGNPRTNVPSGNFGPFGGMIVRYDSVGSDGEVSKTLGSKIGPGGKVRFAIYVNTTRSGADIGEDLSGELTIETTA